VVDCPPRWWLCIGHVGRWIRCLLGFRPSTQSSNGPIVRLDVRSRLLSTMVVHLDLDDRLSVLRAEDRFRDWRSLDDERFCIICKRKFNGRQVEIHRIGNRKYELRCPTEGCNSRTHLWIYSIRLRVAHVIESEWWRAADKTQECGPLGSAPRAEGHRV
jgi:hypothetical protein